MSTVARNLLETVLALLVIGCAGAFVWFIWNAPQPHPPASVVPVRFTVQPALHGEATNEDEAPILTGDMAIPGLTAANHNPTEASK